MKVNLKMTLHMAKEFILGEMVSDQKENSEKESHGVLWDTMNMEKYADCSLMESSRKFIQVPIDVQPRANITKKKPNY